MSMHGRTWSNRAAGLLASGLLGAGAALLAACGGSGKLIPVANSEPMQKDFEEAARAAESGHGNCATTEAALRKVEQDFVGLPASVDPGLRRRLREGIDKLHTDALELCVQPAASTTATTQPGTTTTTTSTPTSTQNTSTQTTSTETTPPTTTNTGPGGGTPAKEGEGEEAGAPKHKGKDGEPGGAGGAGSGEPGK